MFAAIAANVSIYGPQHGVLFPGDAFGQEELNIAVESSQEDASKRAASTKTPSKRNLLLIGGDGSSVHLEMLQALQPTAEPPQRQYTVAAETDCQVLRLSFAEYKNVFRFCPCLLLPQVTGAMAALQVPPGHRTELQLAWICTFMSQQKILSQLPPESIEKLAMTLSLKTFSKGEQGELLSLV